MLLLIGAARLVEICYSLAGANKDEEAGDLYEGDSQRKERAFKSQASKAIRLLHLCLILVSGLNVCTPNDRVGGALARVALLFSLVLATIAFWTASRENRSQSAGFSISNNTNLNNPALHLNSALAIAAAGVLMLIIISRAQQPLLLRSATVSRQGQASAVDALSKHSFGLEKEMAKSARMKLRAQEQKLAALVGAAQEVGDSTHRKAQRAVVDSAIHDEKENAREALNTRGSYLDAIQDAPPVTPSSGRDVLLPHGTRSDDDRLTSEDTRREKEGTSYSENHEAESRRTEHQRNNSENTLERANSTQPDATNNAVNVAGEQPSRTEKAEASKELKSSSSVHWPRLDRGGTLEAHSVPSNVEIAVSVPPVVFGEQTIAIGPVAEVKQTYALEQDKRPTRNAIAYAATSVDTSDDTPGILPMQEHT